MVNFHALRSWFPRSILCVVLFVTQSPFLASAADPPESNPSKLLPLQALIGDGKIGGESEKKVELSATIDAGKGSSAPTLQVTAKIAKGWHIYSLTQHPKGGLPTKIRLESDPGIKVVDKLTPDQKPVVKNIPEFDVPLEEHDGTVTWTGPVEMPASFDPTTFKVKLAFSGLACNDSCMPVKETVDVKLIGFSAQASAPPAPPSISSAPPIPETPAKTFVEKYKSALSHATFTGIVEPQVVQPGGKAKLQFTAEVATNWHIYAHREKDPLVVSKPTLITFTNTSGLALSQPTTTSPTHADPQEPANVPHHEGNVTWTVEVTVPPHTPPGEYPLAGALGFQTCTSNSCDSPAGAEFKTTLSVANASQDGQTPVLFAKSVYSAVAKIAKGENSGIGGTSANAPPLVNQSNANEPPRPATTGGFDPKKIEVASDEDSQRSLSSAIWIALLGGFILNFMPCVLPVIGLKVLSFVQQAGKNRAQAFLLNVWYSLGLLFVFMVLATLAVVFNFGWGQQNQFGAFNITMAAVVFAMGLSFLGVWEIPIPGFVGSGKAAELSEQEGPLGAFLKGIVTTILAVPCSGPGVATALAWCTGKPAVMVYGVFACMALGMASPYLVIGANPRLVRFIPKPGVWMETFKEIMGFVLLATVVFILTYIAWSDVLPTVALLFGIWAACWYIGRTPITVNSNVRMRAWAISLFIVGIVATFSFTTFRNVMESRFQMAADSARQKAAKEATKLDWQPFTVAKLQQLTAEGKTVLVDFTADWCITCKTLEATVLNTKSIQDLLKEKQITTLVADWTNQDDEITAMLDLLGSKQVPVLAIFPAKSPNRPIVIRGGYTVGSLSDKIREAESSEQRVAQHPATSER